MARQKAKQAPEKKYSPNEVLERFRAKDDPELGRYARYAEMHRRKLGKVIEKKTEKERKQREKEEKEKQRKAAREAEQQKQREQAVAPEDLYRDASEGAVAEEYDDADMPSSEIKGKIFSNYQSLRAAPAPGKKAVAATGSENTAGTAPVHAPPKKPGIKELTAQFNQKFGEPKPEKKEEGREKGKPPEKNAKKPARAVVKKKVKKAGKRAAQTAAHSPPAPSHAIGRAPQTMHRKPDAPPLPPAGKVDPRYVKEEVRKQEKEKRKEEKTAQQAAGEAEAGHAAAPAAGGHRSKKYFKTGFWIACGILAFLVLLFLLFVLVVVIIAKFTGVPVFQPLIQNGTLVLP